MSKLNVKKLAVNVFAAVALLSVPVVAGSIDDASAQRVGAKAKKVTVKTRATTKRVVSAQNKRSINAVSAIASKRVANYKPAVASGLITYGGKDGCAKSVAGCGGNPNQQRTGAMSPVDQSTVPGGSSSGGPDITDKEKVRSNEFGGATGTPPGGSSSGGPDITDKEKVGGLDAFGGATGTPPGGSSSGGSSGGPVIVEKKKITGLDGFGGPSITPPGGSGSSSSGGGSGSGGDDVTNVINGLDQGTTPPEFNGATAEELAGLAPAAGGDEFCAVVNTEGSNICKQKD